MQIYLDVAFALNASINYALLSGAARLCGSPVRSRRLLGASLVGAVYACLCFLPRLGFLAGPVWRTAALAAMLWAAFGSGLLAPGAVFLALSLAMGGLVLLLSGALGTGIWLLDGRAYYAVGAPSLALTAGAAYLGARLLRRGTAVGSGGTVRATLRLGDASTELTMLRDTGNTLRDPFTGRPAPVAERRVFERLLGLRMPADAPEAMQTLHNLAPEVRTRLIPYRAVGTEGALLLAVRCDSLRLDRREWKDVYVAVSPTRVSENGQYEGLIGEGE